LLASAGFFVSNGECCIIVNELSPTITDAAALSEIDEKYNIKENVP